MNFTGGTSTQPNVVKMICIRDYVAEVRKKDWKKCCPFNLWGGSEESNRKAEMVYLSLFLENDDHLVNSRDNTEAPNSSIVVSDADGPIQEILSEVHVRLSKKDKQERNLAGLEPKKFRMLSEVYNELDDSGDDLSSDVNNKSCNDNSYYSDDVTLNTFMESKRRMIAGKKDHENYINTETDKNSDEFTLATIVGNGRKTVPAPAPLSGEDNICESPPSSDDDMMAATILFRMSNGGVQKKTLSKTAAEKEAVSKAKNKGPCEDDGHVSPAAVSALLQDVMHKMPVCVMNRNPSEFKTEEAKTFRWEC